MKTCLLDIWRHSMFAMTNAVLYDGGRYLTSKLSRPWVWAWRPAADETGAAPDAGARLQHREDGDRS